MKRLQTIVSTEAPSQREVLWAKPIDSNSGGGFALYLFINKEWKPLKIVDDQGTSTLSDDKPDTIIRKDLDILEEELQSSMANFPTKAEMEYAIGNSSSALTGLVYIKDSDLTLDEPLTQERGHNVYTYNLNPKTGYIVSLGNVEGADIIFNLPNVELDESKMNDYDYLAKVVQQYDIEMLFYPCDCKLFFQGSGLIYFVAAADNINKWIGDSENSSPLVYNSGLLRLNIKARESWLIEGETYYVDFLAPHTLDIITMDSLTLDSIKTQEAGHNVYSCNIVPRSMCIVNLTGINEYSDVYFNINDSGIDESKIEDAEYLFSLYHDLSIIMYIANTNKCRLYFNSSRGVGVGVVDSVRKWIGTSRFTSPEIYEGYSMLLDINFKYLAWIINGDALNSTSELEKVILTAESLDNLLNDGYISLEDGREYIFPPNNNLNIELGLPLVPPSGKGHIKLELHAESGTYTFSSAVANLLIQEGIKVNIQDIDYFLDCHYYNDKWYITGQTFATPPVSNINA